MASGEPGGPPGKWLLSHKTSLGLCRLHSRRLPVSETGSDCDLEQSGHNWPASGPGRLGCCPLLSHGAGRQLAPAQPEASIAELWVSHATGASSPGGVG